MQARPRCSQTFKTTLNCGFSAFTAHLTAGRISGSAELIRQTLHPSLKNIHPPHLLKDCQTAQDRIIQAIKKQERIGLLTDYDVDGICAHVILKEALLKYFGVKADLVDSFIGHRLKEGYGISPGLSTRILQRKIKPSLIITADCGSSDHDRIKTLQNHGIDVIVTDHHQIPAEGIPPSAQAVVNPHRSDCAYPDKHIAGCTVSWLLMSAVRTRLVEEGYLPMDAPKLINSLDCLALGTTADIVSLASPCNRALVKIGLGLMNQLIRPAWRAVYQLTGRGSAPFTIDDLGFQIGPRINARSRMDDPMAALQFVSADTQKLADLCLAALEKSNQTRKIVESQMIVRAESIAQETAANRVSLVCADPDFHAGVQGIVASRLTDKFGLPSIVFSPITPERLSGSARTCNGVHIRQALQDVADLHPDMLLAFGGHRAAAGMEIKTQDLDMFRQAFDDAVRTQSGDTPAQPVILTDGYLDVNDISFNTLKAIQQLEPFGNNFEEPLFEGCFQVRRLRAVGAEPIHLSMELGVGGRHFKAIWFRAIKAGDPMPFQTGQYIRCAYRLSMNEFRHKKHLQLMLAYAAKY